MRESRFYKFVRLVLTPLFKLVYKPNIIGKENILDKEGIILAGNHTNNLDSILLISSTKRLIHFFAKIELFKGPFGFIFKSLGLIEVDRSKKNKNALEMGYKYLEDGKVVGIFPEGTFPKDKKKMLPFKIGAVKMAYETKKKIVPFAIVGEYKRGKIKIAFGKPYNITNSNLDKEINILRDKVKKLIKDIEV